MSTFGELHVTPSKDLIEHEPSDQCPCGPHVQVVDRCGGWLYVHHSLDGREMMNCPGTLTM